jgi:hypothetical protein
MQFQTPLPPNAYAISTFNTFFLQVNGNPVAPAIQFGIGLKIGREKLALFYRHTPGQIYGINRAAFRS